jgi:voltage-gated potassium channel
MAETVITAASSQSAKRPIRMAVAPQGDAPDGGPHDRRARVIRAALLVAAVLALGTLGYSWLATGSVSWLECLYMTVITISTVGFREVVAVEGRADLMLFTIALVLAGGGSVLYFFTAVTVYLVEGDLFHTLWRRRMEKTLREIRDHVIIVGVGSAGVHVAQELYNAGTPLVIVEDDPQRAGRALHDFSAKVPVIQADALDDEVLEQAGIAHASGLVAALGEDRDNLFLCLSARQLRSDLRIVARVVEIRNAEKFRKVGVDAVVSPALMGGRRLAYEILRPAVVSFVDTLNAPASEQSVQLEEVAITAGSAVADKNLREANLRAQCNCMVIGIRASGAKRYTYNPSPDARLDAGGTVLALGNPEELRALKALTRGD